MIELKLYGVKPCDVPSIQTWALSGVEITVRAASLPPTLSYEITSPEEASSVGPKSLSTTVSMPDTKFTFVSYGVSTWSVLSGISFRLICSGLLVPLYGLLPTKTPFM